MEARFHLPGLRNNFPLNMILIDMLKRYPKYFREGIVIASCQGGCGTDPSYQSVGE